MSSVMTKKGLALLAKAQAGAKINFTKVKFGDGKITTGKLEDLNDLINPVKSNKITSVDNIGAGKVRIRVICDNKDLAKDLVLREIGLFATDPDVGEILYCIYNAGESASILPKDSAVVVEKTIDIVTVISNASNVTATIADDLVWTSVYDFNEHRTKAEIDHPDNSVTDKKIGNRTINDNIIADNKTGSLTNLLSRLGNMIKQITGKPNWYTAPATTLQALCDLIVDVASPNKLLKLDSNGKLPANITGDAHTVDGKHAADFAVSGHTHNYAGSDTVGGKANSAKVASNLRFSDDDFASRKALIKDLRLITGGLAEKYTDQITKGEDLNNYKTGGSYCCSDGGTANTLLNCPYKIGNFKLLVFQNTGTETQMQWLTQIMLAGNDARMFFRGFSDVGWTDWKEMADLNSKVALAESSNFLNVVCSNELRFNKNGFSPTALVFNHRWSDDSISPNITSYSFCNGDGKGTKADIYANKFYGNLGGTADNANALNIVASNEIRFNKNGNNPTNIAINYRWADGSTVPIEWYNFFNGDGKGTLAEIKALTPTQLATDSSKKLANTEFVQTLVARTGVLVYGNNWIKLSSGHIIQFGVSANTTVVFPIAFTVECTAVVPVGTSGGASENTGVGSVTTTQFSWTYWATKNSAHWIAIGR